MYRVEGYSRQTNTRRSELKAVTYPIYRATLAALGKGNKAISYEDYLRTEIEKREPLEDPKKLLRRASAKLNPHLKIKID